MDKTKLDKAKAEERKALLSLFYTIGHSDDLANKENKDFRNLINNESKRKKMDPLELLEYFAENKEAFLKLLGKKDIKLLPKFKKIYTHSEIENIMHKVLKTQKLKDNGLSTIQEGVITREVNIWESKGVQYVVKVNDLLKFEGRPPKVYVSQIKNLSLLLGMVQEQQFKNDTKEAKCEFNFTYYAERRGYTKEEIQQSGGPFKELKLDLITGAMATYIVDKIIIEGKKYTVYGIPNFYILYEPEDRKDKWKVEFNNPYGKWILEILNGEAGQYFIKDFKAIEDRTTTDKPFLFLFYQQLIKRKQANLETKPVKIGNLLKDMQIEQQKLDRPKECYNLLKECLIYFSENYQPIPELERFNIYNDFHKTKTVKLPLSISEAFKQYPYEDFKDLLIAIGIKDIREAYISFKRPYVKPKSKEKQNLTEEEQSLLDKTVKWFNDPSNPNKITIPLKDQESLIKRYIKKYGVIEYERLFKREGNKYIANAVEFLTKVLPNFKHDDKDNSFRA